MFNLTVAFSQQDSVIYDLANPPSVFPGTEKLSWDFDVASHIVAGTHTYIDNEIDRSIETRKLQWGRDLSSPDSYVKSVSPNRLRFMKILGISTTENKEVQYNTFDAELSSSGAIEKYSNGVDPIVVGETSLYRIYQVRWSVDGEFSGEGLLLTPKNRIVGNVIAVPDADQTPEQLTGLATGIPERSQFARHLAENGFQVLVPVFIDRTVLNQAQHSQQTYRERIHRQAYHMGEHIIGLEVRKIMAAIDWFEDTFSDLKIGVAGYSEGGLLAFYAAAVDERIDVCLVSGYFNDRQETWSEPLYRNVWGLLKEFGDAEIATLIAPRSLIVEHSFVPEYIDQVSNVPLDSSYKKGLSESGFKGRIGTPDYTTVQSEFERIETLVGAQIQRRYLIGEINKPEDFGSEAALHRFSDLMEGGDMKQTSKKPEISVDSRSDFDPEERQKRQYIDIENYLQRKIEISDITRADFFLKQAEPKIDQIRWSTLQYRPYFDPTEFVENSKKYRKYLNEEIFGTFDTGFSIENVHSRLVYETAKYVGYEVILELVADEFYAGGILLLPKDIKGGEKRPVVVCQHGRGGLPQQLVEGDRAYNNAGARLAENGFIVFAPYAPFQGEDRYRWLDRKANTVKKTLFSFIIAQHEGILDWLGTLPFVDERRIGLYGLSYGGEVAIRVPAVLERYSVAICSGDFGHWTRKVADIHFPSTFMNTREWEMPYFNMGNTFSYSELAYLIFPRAFMVERGHFDLVQPDEWVGYEYAKVNYLYDLYNKGSNCDIEYFNGGHAMRNAGTFNFLRKHLEWP